MLSPLAEALRRHDPDRFLTLLFAPAEQREALATLYAFNHEIARARAVTSQDLLALIRLQWWREVVEGTDKPGEIATPLLALLQSGRLPAAPLEAMIAAREQEVDAHFPDLAQWQAWLLGGAGSLAVAAGHLLGTAAAEVLMGLRLRGAAYGAASLLRARTLPPARPGLLPSWPADLLAAAGLTREDAAADPAHPALRPVYERLRAEARGWLAEARALPLPAARAAALPGILAARDLARPLGLAAAGPRGLGDRLAVTWAGLSGRV